MARWVGVGTQQPRAVVEAARPRGRKSSTVPHGHRAPWTFVSYMTIIKVKVLKLLDSWKTIGLSHCNTSLKYPAFTATQEWRCWQHCLTAWSRCSHLLQLIHILAVNPLLKNVSHFVINRIEDWTLTIGRSQCWRLTLEQIDCLLCNA